MSSSDPLSPSPSCAQPSGATPSGEGVSAASLLALVQTQSAQLALAEQQLGAVQQAHRQTVAALQQAQEQLAHQQCVEQELEQLRQQHHALAAHLHEIQTSTVIRVTRPLVRAKLGLDVALGRRRADAAPLPAAPAALAAPSASDAPAPRSAAVQRAPGVDIIVPVYQGLADTQRCLASVLASTYQTCARVIVINDASPDPQLSDWLRAFAAREPRIMLLENAQNLGFVASVNRGMALSDEQDVLLLNSDTEVAHDWLDRLRAAAYGSADVGTVTPLSNNATICSYPRFCQANELPQGWSASALDVLCAQHLAHEVLDIPTAVGFCMYIRRDCLRQVGLFDVENFGRGYGEENDFCERARALGWRHVQALDTFVLHTGGVSFGADKSPREQAAFALLQRLHPGYAGAVHDFVQRDPGRPLRQRLDVARLRASALPRVLAVSHGWGGGTQRHVEELARHLREQAIFLLLSSQDNGPLRLRWLDERESFSQEFQWPSEQAALVALLRELGVSHVHYHHLVGHTPEVMHLHEHLGVAYDFTVHDYYSACPQISLTTAQKTYCGEQGLAQCRACVHERPAPTQETIDAWQLRHRLFLHQARWVFVPSHDCAQRVQRYFPQARIRYAPHTDMLEHPAAPVRAPLPLPAPRHLRIFLVGGLSAIKGGDVAEAVALEAARLNAPIELHLLGYVFRTFKAQPEASLTIHGSYQEHDLPRLLQRLQPDVVWFPAVWPETYSYTLSTCLQAGLPVVTTDLGAFPERLTQRPWTWVRPWNTSAGDWLAFFLRLRQQFIAAGAPTDEAGQPWEPSGVPEARLGRHDEDWNYARDYLQGLAPASVAAAPASA